MYTKSVVALTTADAPSHQVDIEDFHKQNDTESDILEKVHRSRSDGFVLSNVLSKDEFFPRSLTNSITIPITIIVNQSEERMKNSGVPIFRKIRKLKKKGPAEYRKNICGYITKKIIREFTSVTYFQKVKELCSTYNCDYNDAKAYYITRIENITGPSHIPSLLIPENDSEVNFKKAFRNFFEWFLKERYLRYLLIEGKMSDKKAYIEYKNTEMLYLVHLRNYPEVLKEEMSSINESEENALPFKLPIICIPQVKL